MRKLWIAEEPFPPGKEMLDEAGKAGASEIMHLGDPAVVALGIEKPGYHEIPEPADDADAMRREETKVELASSDARMARATEDLWDALIAKGVLTARDLPKEAADLITNRKSLRTQLT